jgi:hypothetical protein
MDYLACSTDRATLAGLRSVRDLQSESFSVRGITGRSDHRHVHNVGTAAMQVLSACNIVALQYIYV